MIELAAYCDEPIALTSANVSNQPSSLDVSEFESLWPKLDLIVDGGKLNTNLAAKAGSTVIDLKTTGAFEIIRKGRYYKYAFQNVSINHVLYY